jgi:hypothetical protein
MKGKAKKLIMKGNKMPLCGDEPIIDKINLFYRPSLFNKYY